MDEVKRIDARHRKAKSRARQQADFEKFGLAQVMITLKQDDLNQLNELCSLRAVGTEPYSLTEYLSELIANDMKKYQAQIKNLKPCAKCGASLPTGCKGLFKGDSQCFQTSQYRELML